VDFSPPFSFTVIPAKLVLAKAGIGNPENILWYSSVVLRALGGVKEFKPPSSPRSTEEFRFVGWGLLLCEVALRYVARVTPRVMDL